MSLDLYIGNVTCDKCGHDIVEAENFNCTYNLVPMWRKIYPDGGFVDIEGLTGEEAKPKLVFALNKILNNREQFEKLNPENGWGSCEGFILFLRKLISACDWHPHEKWGAWR